MSPECANHAPTDRRKIKKFIKAKEEALRAVRLKRQAYINMGQIDESPKHVVSDKNKENVSFQYKETESQKSNNEKSPCGPTSINNSRSPPKYEKTSTNLNNEGNSPQNSVYSIDTSLRHIASMESLTDGVMKSFEDRHGPTIQNNNKSSVSDNLQRSPPRSVSSSSPGSANMTLPEDYVNATKTLRRYSYQVACREPNIEKAAPQFAKSDVIIKTYRNNNVAFENVAYNCDRNP
uniref:Uncharacterized protein n=1 Tax=Magallana gigas TaxID=29159 RepID=K1RXZ2_MAGGI